MSVDVSIAVAIVSCGIIALLWFAEHLDDDGPTTTGGAA